MAVAPLPSREAEQRVLAAYDKALARIRRDAFALADRQRRALERGEAVSPSWLFRQRRYRQLEATTLREINRLSTLVERETRRAQAQVIPIGAAAAMRDVAQYAPTRQARATVARQWGLFDPSDVEQLVGNTGDGRPLGELLHTFGPAARDAVTHALVVGIVAGHSPRKTAPAVANALGATGARALTITRTETIRVYRETRIQSMAQSRVVGEWVWVCTATACPACWAMQGSVHPIVEPFGSHPNCRCAPVAKTISWSALGIDAPDTSPYIEKGSTLFAKLHAGEQKAILGPGGHELYKRGVPLERFGRRTYSAYGPGLRRVPNRELAFYARVHPNLTPR